MPQDIFDLVVISSAEPYAKGILRQE